MTIDRNDPRLTAYALGELAGTDKDAFERELAADPTARAEVEAIRALGKTLTQDLTNEPAPALTDMQRQSILASPPAARRRQQSVPLTRAVLWLSAASVIGVVAGVFLLTFTSEGARRARDMVFSNAPALSPCKPVFLASKCQTNLSDLECATIEAQVIEDAPLQKEVLPQEPISTEDYGRLIDNPWRDPKLPEFLRSTFSIDVDTASYANIRRILNQGNLPPPDAVRIEEMINYFDYAYEPPVGEHPFAVHTEIATCPWAPEHRLAKIGLKGKVFAQEGRPASNLVFLLDVSGSMDAADKLGLVKQALKLLVGNLDQRDRIAIAVYAGAAGLVLEPTSGAEKSTIFAALDALQAGGSTAGGAGIELAYKTAMENFIQGGVNRVILCTDGDFNVGVTGDALVRIVEEKAKGGVYLSVFGFGMGNLKDGFMEDLTNKGNGNYGYIDTLNEAKKVFGEQLGGTLVTIAKDVKIQVVFNRMHVGAYRLIGYANRMLKNEDFDNDQVDAGDIGAGHTVTALYEIVPPGLEAKVLKNAAAETQPAPAQTAADPEEPTASEDLFTLKLRYKAPDGETSQLLSVPVPDAYSPVEGATEDFRFAAGVAAFGLLLRGSPYKGSATYDLALQLAQAGKGADAHGYRAEFVTLVQKAKNLKR